MTDHFLLGRRDFMRLGASTAGIIGVGGSADLVAASRDRGESSSGPGQETPGRAPEGRPYNGAYEGARLEHIAFPMGGFGAGMICLEGTGALSRVSLRHRPDMIREPGVFAALCVKAPTPIARVLEGPVPSRKRSVDLSRNAITEVSSWWGLPRFRKASFTARFPFGRVELSDEAMPLSATLTGWSPFEPGDADNASLPVAGLEYQFHNHGAETVEAVFSFNAMNFMAEPDFSKEQSNSGDRVIGMPGGFQLIGAGSPRQPWDAGTFAAWVDDPSAQVNAAWFRGGWYDAATIAWRDVQNGACFNRPAVTEGPPAPGATLFVPFKLAPAETKTIAVRLAWFVKSSNLNRPGGVILWPPWEAPAYTDESLCYKPWYANRFADIGALCDYWQKNYQPLRHDTERFTQAFYSSTLPPEVLEAVGANLTILKSTTVLRQADGRFWAWEGSLDEFGSCEGSCTHVWNYAQALCHLFPSLERTLRETEFGANQRVDGHQDFRAALPIRPTPHNFYAAADGQLGGIMKVYRDWRISADIGWLRGLWPKVRASLDYCIRTWDPKNEGWLEEPHHNTYDIEFWGPDALCTGIYLGALQAAVLMGKALADDVTHYAGLLRKGVAKAETELFNGEYFFQKVKWRNLLAHFPDDSKGFVQKYTPEALALANKEGPRYQYGDGCLSDGVLGAWLALVCGVGQVLDAGKVKNHLRAVYRHNFRKDLSDHSNPQRAVFAFGDEGGLLLCTWPGGQALSLPFIYSNEVWTGIEYQVASHLMLMGLPEEGLSIVRACRDRYDGRSRNPFDEVEAGHWYARAMASYGLLQGLSGARYDAVDKVLYLRPAIKGDFRSFLATATGYGMVGIRNGAPFVDVVAGHIPYAKIEYVAA
jgi:uncharacterized protein (DUF608 family)